MVINISITCYVRMDGGTLSGISYCLLWLTGGSEFWLLCCTTNEACVSLQARLAKTGIVCWVGAGLPIKLTTFCTFTTDNRIAVLSRADGKPVNNHRIFVVAVNNWLTFGSGRCNTILSGCDRHPFAHFLTVRAGVFGWAVAPVATPGGIGGNQQACSDKEKKFQRHSS
jgi:hypothetical protein